MSASYTVICDLVSFIALKLSIRLVCIISERTIHCWWSIHRISNSEVTLNVLSYSNNFLVNDWKRSGLLVELKLVKCRRWIVYLPRRCRGESSLKLKGMKQLSLLGFFFLNLVIVVFVTKGFGFLRNFNSSRMRISRFIERWILVGCNQTSLHSSVFRSLNWWERRCVVGIIKMHSHPKSAPTSTSAPTGMLLPTSNGTRFA